MNVIIEDESKKNNKLKIFYIFIISICVIATIVALIIQALGNNQSIQKQNGTILPELTDNKISVYKEEFNNVFENKVNYLKDNSYKITKIEQDKEIVYLGYQNIQIKANDYELNVNIPYINIKDETIYF